MKHPESHPLRRKGFSFTKGKQRAKEEGQGGVAQRQKSEKSRNNGVGKFAGTRTLKGKKRQLKKLLGYERVH